MRQNNSRGASALAALAFVAVFGVVIALVHITLPEESARAQSAAAGAAHDGFERFVGFFDLRF